MLHAYQEAAWVKFLTNPAGLYLHIPFCERKCNYCNFYSRTATEEYLDRYCDGLIKEITKWGGNFNRPIDTIYLGGGTPSLLNERIIALTNAVYSSFNVLPNPEITLELNPAGDTQKMLDYALESGVNRLSIGAQSGDDRELEILGRRHSAADIEKTVSLARKKGFQNISLDIMAALPDSTTASLEKSLEFIKNLEPEHISAYLLKIEEQTVFGKKADMLNLPDDDNQAQQYLFMCDYFENAGYEHYEISNFCKDGKISRHNIKYWLGDEYLGIGPSAHSFVNGKRFYYPPSISEFTHNGDTVEDGAGGGKEEYIMLRLRLTEGINPSEYAKKFESELPKEFIECCKRFEKANFMNIHENRINLTNEGMLLSNSIISELLDCLE